jgi:predicted phosphate transport protein (TIGR00153 family)
MAFSLIPRETKFFDLFDQAAATLTRASFKFLDMVTHFDRLSERSQELRNEEHTCDEIVGGIIRALDRTFITPFDREDIHTLATALDDVMDNLEETAHRFVTFRIESPTAESVLLARIIHECCGHLEQAVQRCRSMKEINAIQESLQAIARLENEADQIYRESDARLFADPPEMLLLIKWRELYGWLEETVDACKEVAMVLSEILIKGS